MIAFVSGHRDLTEEEFDLHYVPELERAVEWGTWIIVCDYYGADIMTQAWLLGRGYGNVTVVHMLDAPRNYVGTFETVGRFKSDEERDAWCTAHSDYDIAWSRKPGSGTARNLERRQEQLIKKRSAENVVFQEKP
jgi:hypothetical protein